MASKNEMSNNLLNFQIIFSFKLYSLNERIKFIVVYLAGTLIFKSEINYLFLFQDIHVESRM